MVAGDGCSCSLLETLLECLHVNNLQGCRCACMLACMSARACSRMRSRSVAMLCCDQFGPDFLHAAADRQSAQQLVQQLGGQDSNRASLSCMYIITIPASRYTPFHSHPLPSTLGSICAGP